MSADKLTKIEAGQLHAFLDGELPAEQAHQVAARVESEPVFSAEAEAYRRLDALLDAWQAPPLRRDLTQAILARTAQKRDWPAWVRLLAPVAAAAMIFLAVWTFHAVNDGGAPPGRTPISQGHGSGTGKVTPLPIEPLPKDLAVIVAEVPVEDHFAVENLDLFTNYEILSSFETLEAIERLESSTGGA